MNELTREELVERLVRDWGYSDMGAHMIGDQVDRMSPPVRDAFIRWWSSGESSDLQIEGYTMAQLMHEHQMNPMAAWLTLDWLSREPEKARAALKAGHDRLEGQPRRPRA